MLTVGNALPSSAFGRANPSLTRGADVWEATHIMSEPRSALQDVLSQAVARSDKTRDYFDGLLRKKLETTGKPLWDVERGKVKKPGPKVLRAMEEVLGFPSDYLVNLVHPDDRQPRRPALDITRAPDIPGSRNASSGETASIVSLDLSLSMGPGTPIEDFVESEPVEFDIGLLRTITRSPYDRLRIVRGIGNSMEPKFYTGDQILVDTTERQLTRIDGYYWITLYGAHGLKRLRPLGGGKVRVISENKEDFDPIDVEAADITIEGRAIWVGREL